MLATLRKMPSSGNGSSPMPEHRGSEGNGNGDDDPTSAQVMRQQQHQQQQQQQNSQDYLPSFNNNAHQPQLDGRNQAAPNLVLVQQQLQHQPRLQQNQATATTIQGFDGSQLAALGPNSATAVAQLQQLVSIQQSLFLQQQLLQAGNQGMANARSGVMMYTGDSNPAQLAAISGTNTASAIGMMPPASSIFCGDTTATMPSNNSSSAAPGNTNSIKAGRRNAGEGKRGGETSFPVKLHRILSTPQFMDIICWLPHGRSWRILKPSAFEERIIPLYFRHAKYASFMRQVRVTMTYLLYHGSSFGSVYRCISELHCVQWYGLLFTLTEHCVALGKWMGVSEGDERI